MNTVCFAGWKELSLSEPPRPVGNADSGPLNGGLLASSRTLCQHQMGGASQVLWLGEEPDLCGSFHVKVGC